MQGVGRSSEWPAWGAGMADCDPRLAKAFLDVSAKHYPERLGQFFVVDAPSVFSLLWKGIR